jgi:hypothetical protein
VINEVIHIEGAVPEGRPISQLMTVQNEAEMKKLKLLEHGLIQHFAPVANMQINVSPGWSIKFLYIEQAIAGYLNP